jgi:hypothetical protein
MNFFPFNNNNASFLHEVEVVAAFNGRSTDVERVKYMVSNLTCHVGSN